MSLSLCLAVCCFALCIFLCTVSVPVLWSACPALLGLLQVLFPVLSPALFPGVLFYRKWRDMRPKDEKSYGVRAAAGSLVL